jgi:hypothetical protein
VRCGFTEIIDAYVSGPRPTFTPGKVDPVVAGAHVDFFFTLVGGNYIAIGANGDGTETDC